MAIKTMDMPICDVCGSMFLPRKGPARDNPRKHAKRCGTCKNPRWDYKYHENLKAEKDQPAATQSKPCRHRVLNCPICHPGEKT